MTDVPQDCPKTREWDNGNSEWYTDDLRDAADAMRDELLEQRNKAEAALAMERENRAAAELCWREAEAALAEARAEVERQRWMLSWALNNDWRYINDRPGADDEEIVADLARRYEEAQGD